MIYQIKKLNKITNINRRNNIPNLLVVDDVGLIRYKVKNELYVEGINVFEAPKANLVINYTFSKNISLKDIEVILLDIYLKEKNGLEILEYIKNKYSYIKVIRIRVESKKNTIKKAISLGTSDYLVKPFDKEILLSKVNKLLAKTDNKNEEIKTSRNKNDELMTILSNELNRAVRSELSMFLVRMAFPENNKEEPNIEILVNLKIWRENLKMLKIDINYFLKMKILSC